MRRARILFADNHTMICAGFQKLLEPEYEVVGTVKDGLALLKVAAELKPDVVLVDIQPGTVWDRPPRRTASDRP